MLAISADKIDSLFAALSAKGPLYIPVDNQQTGKADFVRYSQGLKLSSALKTVRSAKDFFFPKSECLVNYKRCGKCVKVEDPRQELEDFVVFGVRACDAVAISCIDAVYLNMKPVDSYYKNRRDHGTIVTLACNNPARTCLCKSFGIDAAAPAGDVEAVLADGQYFFKANTPKGEAFVDTVKTVLAEADAAACQKEQEAIRAKVEALPFSHLNLNKFKGENMMKIFNSKIWDGIAESCLGCGACTYMCPSCMCFDVRDFKTADGITQTRCWDSCMYSDFTQMAAANPRLTQKERSRQRFMHKLLYYPMAHEGKFLCVGCGRCVESCPINMNVVKVINAINQTDDIEE